MSISSNLYGKTEEGKDIYIFKLTNSSGMVCEIMNYGGVILSILVPDRHGCVKDVTLGFENLEDYFKKGPFLGALIGRYGNRIGNAVFELNGRTYTLGRNEGNNHLHGGFSGYDKKLWEPRIIKKSDNDYLELTYKSADGEEGYPGNLDVSVLYSLTEDNELRIDYSAVSDADTIVNLTNHAYFNLGGHDSGSISSHQLTIHADLFTVVNSESIPTGELRNVKGTPFDFTAPKVIEAGLQQEDEQLTFGHGFDHNWVINRDGSEMVKAAEVYEESSGRVMEVYTTKPGIQFYTGNYLEGCAVGKGGTTYKKRSGLCLETQYFPDGMRHAHFPSPVLKAGEKYKHTTIYKFSAR